MTSRQSLAELPRKARRSLGRIASGLLLAARSQAPLGRSRLAIECLRLELKRILWKLRERQPRFESLLGYRVHFLDYGLLVHSFREVFLRQDYYFRSSERSPTIIDCGGNIGMSMLFFKAVYPTATVLVFEPDERAAEVLRMNTEVNRLAGVKIFPQAVAGHTGTIPFYRDPAQPGCLKMSTRPERDMPERCLVGSVRLSEVLPDHVDFLKLDIEGGETAVIEDLLLSERLRRVEQAVIEYHHHLAPEEDELSELLARLERGGFGYQIWGFSRSWPENHQYQDLLIRAYRK